MDAILERLLKEHNAVGRHNNYYYSLMKFKKTLTNPDTLTNLRYGLADKKEGNIVVPCVSVNMPTRRNDGFWQVDDGTNIDIVNDGECLTNFSYVQIDEFKGKYTTAWQSKTDIYYAGIINRKGKEIIPCEYDTAYLLEGDKFLMLSGNNSILFDNDGVPINRFIDFGGFDEEGIARISKYELSRMKKKMIEKGFIDQKGNFNIKREELLKKGTNTLSPDQEGLQIKSVERTMLNKNKTKTKQGHNKIN